MTNVNFVLGFALIYLKRKVLRTRVTFKSMMFAKTLNKLPKWAKYQNFSLRVVTLGHESKDCIILTRFVVPLL